VGDARVFQNSYLGRNYEALLRQYDLTELPSGDDKVENICAFILGDSAYPNTRHLVTTYKVTECDRDPCIRKLNRCLSKARYHVEHAFGLLKGRFQIFAKPLKSASEDYAFAMHLIASIFVMHNFLIDTRDPVPNKDVLPPEIAGQLEECAAGTRESLEDLGGNEDVGENQAEDAVFQQVPNNGRESTRNALLRHIRWLEDVAG
jgi:DDE superfamily endonuclease